MASKEILNKIAVKQALADKYGHLATLAGSIPKRDIFNYHARRFRSQVHALKKKYGVE